MSANQNQNATPSAPSNNSAGATCTGPSCAGGPDNKKSACDEDGCAGGRPLDPCIPRLWTRIFNLVLAGVIAVVALYAVREFNGVPNDDEPEIKREKMRLLAATVSTCGIIAWPILWDNLIGYAVITHHPLTMFGFMWPILMNMLDLASAATSSSAVQTETAYGIADISSDSNMLVGIAFAVGSFLSSQSNAKLVNATIPLLMYALLLLIAFIVPTPSLNPNDYTGFAAGATQRTFFNYAMGLIITGISINVSGQGGRGLQRALTAICLEKESLSGKGWKD